MKARIGQIFVFLCMLLVTGSFIDNHYYSQIFTLSVIWAIFGLSWNIVGGYAGLVSFGHAAFFGLGAFSIAIGEYYYGISPWIMLPISLLIGGSAGLLIGYPTLRLKGHYFALAMLAYPLALLYLFEWMGFQEITIPMRKDQPIWHMQFSNPFGYFLLSLGVLCIAMLSSLYIERSRFGLSLFSIRADVAAAEAAGINTRYWMNKAMVVSGALAALAGGLYTVVLLVITPPSVFGLIVSSQAIILTLFGGSGSYWGPVIGALLIIPLTEVLNANLGSLLPGIQGVLLGAALIAVMLFAPRGVYWWLAERLKLGVTESHAKGPEPNLNFTIGLPSLVNGTLMQVCNISRNFGGIKALDSLSFSLTNQRILGIIGPNGAGKTTLFDVLNGFTQADSGQILFNGINIVGCKTHQIAQMGIARTFQIARIFSNESVYSNVLAGAWTNSSSPKDALEKAEQAIGLVGLARRSSALGNELTNKEVRLLEIARAIASKPSLLLLDETLAGLSKNDIKAVVEVIRRLADMGMRIIIIEHTIQAVLQLADQLLVLDHGRLLAIGETKDVIANPLVIEAYLGKKWITKNA